MSMRKKEKKDKKMTFFIQPSLYEKFQKKCSENYKDMSEILRNYIIEYIKENNGKK